MRIYTKHVWQWQPDGTLKSVPEECESFEYEGPVALCKSPPSQPAPPDYLGAAEQQAASQRVNQNTPYGSQTWTDFVDGRGDLRWNSNITLAPLAQDTLDSQMRLSRDMGNLAEGQVGRVEDAYAKPMDLSSVQQTADKAYGALTSRLDPQWQQRGQQQETQLRNQGLVPGGEAYEDSMRSFNNARNDAYQQANLAAIQTMPQTYQLASSQYNQPLNTLNAMRSGSQVQNPQFQSMGPGTDYMSAAQGKGMFDLGQYNTGVGITNAQNQGTFDMASLAAAAAMFFSDRRLKSNIVRVGTHPLGIGIYEYDIFGNRETGVMADEVEKVKPEAVGEMDGFKTVNYGLLNA